jgi:hypothetical protein
MDVFIVTMYRWGERHNHSYVLGVYSSGRWAITYAIVEQGWRGNKYRAEVLRCKLDEEAHEVVYGNIKDGID